MDVINLAEERVRLWALVNMGNGHLSFINVGYFLTKLGAFDFCTACS
jgi:hypothetical protein